MLGLTIIHRSGGEWCWIHSSVFGSDTLYSTKKSSPSHEFFSLLNITEAHLSKKKKQKQKNEVQVSKQKQLLLCCVPFLGVDGKLVTQHYTQLCTHVTKQTNKQKERVKNNHAAILYLVFTIWRSSEHGRGSLKSHLRI